MRTLHRVTVVALWSILLLSGRLAGAEAPHAIEIRCAGTAAVLPDAGDAVLREIVDLLPGRLAELPEDLDVDPGLAMLAPVMEILLAHPFDLTISAGEQGPIGQLTLHTRGRNPEADVERLLQQMGGGAGQVRGGVTWFGPEGGPQVGLTTREWRGASCTIVTLGQEPREPLSLESPLFDRLAPVFTLRVDFDQLAAAGLGPAMAVGDALGRRIEVAVAYDDDRLRLAARMESPGALMNDVLASGRVTRSDLAAVPADALFAGFSQFDIGALVAWIESQDASVLDEFNHQFGMNLKADLLDHLGPTMTTYRSESMGGGGIMSTVLLWSLRDADAFVEGMTRLCARVDDAIDMESAGRVRIHLVERDNRPWFLIQTPGIPIPLEISMAVEGDHMVLAAAPWVADAAIEHMAGGRRSLQTNPSVGARLRDHEDMLCLTYVDAEAVARDSYGVMTGLLSALRNAVRSPMRAHEFVNGPPDWHTFTADVKPFIFSAHLEGDALYVEGDLDRSALVNGAVLMRTVGTDFHGTGAVAAGMVLPALGRARTQAKNIKSATQVRGIVQSVLIYYNDAGQMPESTGELVDWQILTRDMLMSPYGPAPDLGPDYAVVLDSNWAETFNSRQPVAIDRAAYFAGVLVPVGFADGHVEMLPVPAVNELLLVHKDAAVALDLGPDLGLKHKELPRQTEAASGMRQILMAFMIYGTEHDDACPASLDAIVPYLDDEVFSLAQAARLRWDLRRFSSIHFPARTVVGVLATRGKTVVGFADGHVEMLDRDELADLLAEEPNKGFDEEN